MSQENYTTDSRKNKHLTYRERCNIEILLKENMTTFEISKRLGRHKRTIEREIGKGTIRLLNSNLSYREEYCADTGQRVYDRNGSNKGPNLKIGKDHKLAKHIEQRIVKEKYSPDAVIGEIKAKSLKFETSICTKTLYNYIDQEVFANITNKDLPVKKEKKKGSYRKVRIAHKNLKGTSIEERPAEIESREEYGHWEMDCVVGNHGGSGSALLVLSERQRREEIIYKMQGKTQESVIKVLDSLEKKYGKCFRQKFKTITVDNGSEFLDFKGIERSVNNPEEQRVKVYYAHPYSSWERGTNENSNKLIRRFIPKGTDIGKISKKRIKYIEKWMNNYPRRILGYKSANDLAV
jgi:IS30 family transposase